MFHTPKQGLLVRSSLLCSGLVFDRVRTQRPAAQHNPVDPGLEARLVDSAHLLCGRGARGGSCASPLPGGCARRPPTGSPSSQLHHLVSDDVCLKVVELYLNEKKRGAAGGNLSSRCVRAARETSYQWKAERCMADENCFKVRGAAACPT